MKRKIVFCLLLSVVTLCANAQNLTQQMFQLYKGQVKTLVQRVEGMEGEGIAQFDRNGRVLSYEGPEGKMEYSWSDDNSSVEIRGYNNGQLLGAQMIYISEMSANRYKYEVGGASSTVEFKSNGAVSKQTASMNGQTQNVFFYYEKAEDMFPYKMVSSMGGQSMSNMVKILETDSHGNPTRVSQTINGQTLINRYEITYY